MASIDKLRKSADQLKMSDSEKEEQRRSFVYGSTKIENDRITRELVQAVSERLKNS